MSFPPLIRDEYVEQAYFFRLLRERQADGVPAQEAMDQARDEILASTRMPIAIEFLKGELIATGGIGEGMAKLPHYFAPFQSFIMKKAELEVGRFDMPIALAILEREAEYRADAPPPAGLFFYQFECLARNRLGYSDGIDALQNDPLFDEAWSTWIGRLPKLLGTLDLTHLVYSRSEFYRAEQDAKNRRHRVPPGSADAPEESEHKNSPVVLFNAQEGKIAKANRGKDPLYFFAALQRQLNYPTIPKTAPPQKQAVIHPAIEARLQRIEKQMTFLEMEQQGKLDLSDFYQSPEEMGGK